MIPEKLSPIERALVAAASKPPHEARKILMLICESGMTVGVPVEQPAMSEGAKHYAKREKSIRRMKASCDRTLDYAKHETLRNIERHFRDNPPITSAEGAPESEPTGTLAARLTFRKPDFTPELLAALREESLLALQIAGQQLFDELGRDDPWKMPGEYASGFLNYRENLLSKVPDEVHAEIMDSIQQGLEHGDTRKELMGRIASKFDEISKGRAETIANTETAAAFNFARDRAMKEAGVTHKKWLLSHSPLIKEHRITHEENDGQVQPIDEPFDIGGVQFMYPGDDQLGAGPEDIINCHCVAIPVEAPIESAGESEGHPFRGNQYTGGIQAIIDKPTAEMTPEEVVHFASEFQRLRKERNKLASWPAYQYRMEEEHGEDYTRQVKSDYGQLRDKSINAFGFSATKYDKSSAGEKFLDSHQVAERTFAPETAKALHKRAILAAIKNKKPFNKEAAAQYGIAI